MPKSRRKKAAAAARKARSRRRPAARSSNATEAALAGLAHDIRTPLTGIVALAELLNTSDLPEREARWAAAIKGAAEHLARLTTLVVDAAKAEASGIVLRAELFSPRDLARSVGEALAARAEGKGLKSKISIARGFPTSALGDPIRLRSALENLIDNAVKFTERGSVTFAASADRDARGRWRLVFVVTDSGIGIVAGDLKRLFKPFSQANEEVARRYGGAGLGLAFVKRVAKAMGGDLTVTSTPGRGSSFRFSVMAAPAARAGPVAAAARAKPSRGLRVLCAEDNPYGRVVLNAVLGELGHHVSFAGSGEAAVEIVARGNTDAVLMDIELSGIDGFEATRRIRALPLPAGRVPIIGLSGRSADRDEAAAKAAGMDGYLRKPASALELNETLAGIAAGKQGPKTP